MSIVHHLNRKSLPIFLVALSIASLILLSSTGRAFAAPTGANFDHMLIIATENQHYGDVLGDGRPSGCPSRTAPYLCGLLPVDPTTPTYPLYCFRSSVQPS